MVLIFVDVIKMSPPRHVSSFTRVMTSYIASLCISSSFYTPNKLLKFPRHSKSNYTHWRLFDRTSPVVNIVLCSLFPIKNNMINGIHYGGHVWRAATVVSLALTKIETWFEMSVSLYAHIDYQIIEFLCIIRPMNIDTKLFKNN